MAGGLNEQVVYKKPRAAIITRSILALTQQLAREAPYGVGSDDGGAEQSDCRERLPSLISPVGSIRLEPVLSQMPCLVGLSPPAKCSIFSPVKNFSLGSVFPENGRQMTRRI